MNFEVHFSSAAQADIDQIFDYISIALCSPVVDEIYNLRKKYPCDAEKWYECKTEFMLGIEDGLGIVWNRPNMMVSEFIDKIQKFCLEKNIGIDIKVVDGEKS